jgi:hypothetical protein
MTRPLPEWMREGRRVVVCLDNTEPPHGRMATIVKIKTPPHSLAPRTQRRRTWVGVMVDGNDGWAGGPYWLEPGELRP